MIPQALSALRVAHGCLLAALKACTSDGVDTAVQACLGGIDQERCVTPGLAEEESPC